MVVTYKCPGCGGGMEFDGQSGQLACSYCGTHLSVEEYEKIQEQEAPLGEDTYIPVEQEDASTVQMKMYHCPSCGAELMTDEHTTALICSYCGNPGLIADRMTGVQQPKAVVPFKITREEAVKRFLKWTKNGLLTPADFTSKNTLDKITGMYVPYWLYDYDINVRMRARATRSRVTRMGDMEYTYTDHYSVYRNVDAEFEKIPVDASERMDDKVMESLEPYHYNELKEFEMGYLSGYLAEKYNFASTDLRGRATERAKDAAVDMTRNTIIGYHTVSVMDQAVQVSEREVSYVMLPVWVLNYTYNGEQYTFTLNGQTGKLNGKLPISKGKMVKWFGIITAAAFAINMAISVIGGLL